MTLRRNSHDAAASEGDRATYLRIIGASMLVGVVFGLLQRNAGGSTQTHPKSSDDGHRLAVVRPGTAAKKAVIGPSTPVLVGRRWCDAMLEVPLPSKMSDGMRDRCEKLRSTCIDDPEWMRTNHPLLLAGLWRQCTGESPVIGMIDIMKRAIKGAGGQWEKTNDMVGGGPFHILYKPADDPDAPAVALELTGKGSSLCDLFTIDRSKIRRKFILTKFHSLNGHVDQGRIGWYNFGALSSGYDYACHSSSTRRAYVKGCAMVYELATHCPEHSFSDLIDLLDDPNLLAFVVSQDVFTYRKDLSHKLKAHPKVLPLPLGVNFRDAKGWARDGEHFQQLVKLVTEDKWERDHLIIARDSQAYQRQALHLQMRGRFGDVFEAGNNKDKSRDFYIKDLTESRFLLSPPGWGSDCYRHWEALLMGITPLVLSTSIASSGGLAHTPALVYDDYSMVSKESLDAMWQKVINTPPEDLRRLAAPAFQEYWANILQKVLSEKVPAQPPLDVSLHIKIPGRECGNHTFDAASQSLEHQTNRYAFLKLSANVQAADDNRPREYCECPCQCGLCEPDALVRDWKQIDNLHGWGREQGDIALLHTMYNGKGSKKGHFGGRGGDAYHAFRCPLVGNQPSDIQEEPCT